MNIFNKVTLQSLKKNRSRTLVTIIGVVLSAAMITAVATFGVSLLDYMTKGAVQKYGGWHVAFMDADPSFLSEQAEHNEVSGTAAFENIGYAELSGNKDPAKPYAFIAGFGEETFKTLPVYLYSGRLPRNSKEVLVSGKAGTKGGVEFSSGDTLTLSVGKRMDQTKQLSQSDPYDAEKEMLEAQKDQTYTVVGICRTPVFEGEASPGFTLITMSDASKTGADLSVFVTLKNPRQVHTYAEKYAEGHASVFNNQVLRFMGLSSDSGDQLFTALLYAVGAIVVFIIMMGSVFLIYNSFHISLNERTQQFGILASVGATAKQLRNSVIFEGLCIGAVSIPIGLLVGLGSIGLVITIVAGKFGNILYAGVPLTLKISVPTIAAAAVVSLITILISAYIPARKAANMPVMECIRQTNEIKVEAKAVKSSKLVQRLFGLEGILALKNFRRNKKRYRSIVLSLILSILLFVSTSAFVIDLKQAADQMKVYTNYDIGFGVSDMEENQFLELYDKLKTAGGVYESNYQFVTEGSCIIRKDMCTDALKKSWETAGADDMVELPLDIQFLDDNTYLGILHDFNLQPEEYTGENAKLLAVAKMPDENGTGGDVHQLPDMFTSSLLDITLLPDSNGIPNPGNESIRSISCVQMNLLDIPPNVTSTGGNTENLPYFFQIMAPYSMMREIVSESISSNMKAQGMTFRTKNPSQTVVEMKEIILDSGITSAYVLLNTSEMLDESRNYIFIANVFAYTFILMISLIAVANVFNTISTNIKLRRRELAMLRSVGMPDGDFNKMMRFECAFYGMRALMFGLPLSLVSSWLIYKGMFAAGAEGIRFTLPWGSIGISIFSVLLVIFVTMMYAVSKIKKENIIDALRDEMT